MVQFCLQLLCRQQLLSAAALQLLQLPADGAAS